MERGKEERGGRRGREREGEGEGEVERGREREGRNELKGREGGKGEVDR